MAHAFNAGALVVIQGVIAKPELNGLSGTVRSFDEGRGGYVVEVPGTGVEARPRHTFYLPF